MKLRKSLSIFILWTCVGCSPSSGDNATFPRNDHLRCAALVSAADTLIVQGKLKRDEEFDKKSLVAVMSHVNGYAIPKNLPEEKAMADVKAERAKVLASMKPAEIWVQAQACLK